MVMVRKRYKSLDKIKNKGVKGTIAALKDFKSKLKPIVDDILTYTKLGGKTISKNKILKTIREQISSLFSTISLGCHLIVSTKMTENSSLLEHVLSKGEDWRGSESPPGISLPLFGKITQYGLYSTI